MRHPGLQNSVKWQLFDARNRAFLRRPALPTQTWATASPAAGRLRTEFVPVRGSSPSSADCRRVPFAFYCRNGYRSPKLRKLIAECGHVDIDDPQPAITLMLPDGD